MRPDFDGHRDVWGPLLTLQLRSWASTFFAQADALRTAGLFRPETLGAAPPRVMIPGSGPHFTSRAPAIHEHDVVEAAVERLRYFDMAAEEYVSAVGDFVGPILSEVEATLRGYADSHARVLDVACGPGDEAARLALGVPDGEVVAVDLSLPCLREARRRALEHGAMNTVFHRLDAERLPAAWTGTFDVAVCVLSLHFIENAAAAAAEMRRVLRPGGMAFVAEPGSPELNRLSAPLVQMANPAFTGYHTAPELVSLLEAAGFSRAAWTEVLPGIGIVVAGT